MTTVAEIAPDVYRISTYEPQFKLQFNQFLVKDKEPLLFHTGMKGMFPVHATHHLPHSWDAGMLFEETNRTLFTSDLFLHGGDVEPLTESDVIGRARKAMVDFHLSNVKAPGVNRDSF